MKRDVLSFVVASGVALGIFALNYALRGDGHSAHASVFSNVVQDVEKPYSDRSRETITRNISHSPERILRLSGRDIYEVLDEPELVRRDLPTIVWQYRSSSCVLDVFFTASGDNVLAEPVVHYEVRSRRHGEQGHNIARTCVSSLIKSRESFGMIDAQAFYKSSL